MYGTWFLALNVSPKKDILYVSKVWSFLKSYFLEYRLFYFNDIDGNFHQINQKGTSDCSSAFTWMHRLSEFTHKKSLILKVWSRKKWENSNVQKSVTLKPANTYCCTVMTLSNWLDM